MHCTHTLRDYQWDQQFIFNNGSKGTINDGTLSLKRDPHTCVDGMAGGGDQVSGLQV
jgi:hypothetical protein